MAHVPLRPTSSSSFNNSQWSIANNGENFHREHFKNAFLFIFLEFWKIILIFLEQFEVDLELDLDLEVL